MANPEWLVQSLVSSLEKKVDEGEKKYEESNKLAMEAETEIIKLKTEMQRLIYNFFSTLESVIGQLAHYFHVVYSF